MVRTITYKEMFPYGGFISAHKAASPRPFGMNKLVIPNREKDQTRRGLRRSSANLDR